MGLYYDEIYFASGEGCVLSCSGNFSFSFLETIHAIIHLNSCYGFPIVAIEKVPAHLTADTI